MFLRNGHQHRHRRAHPERTAGWKDRGGDGAGHGLFPTSGSFQGAEMMGAPTKEVDLKYIYMYSGIVSTPWNVRFLWTKSINNYSVSTMNYFTFIMLYLLWITQQPVWLFQCPLWIIPYLWWNIQYQPDLFSMYYELFSIQYEFSSIHWIIQYPLWVTQYL